MTQHLAEWFSIPLWVDLDSEVVSNHFSVYYCGIPVVHYDVLSYTSISYGNTSEDTVKMFAAPVMDWMTCKILSNIHRLM